MVFLVMLLGRLGPLSFRGVVCDVALRQRLLELVDLRIGEVGVVGEVKPRQIRQSGQWRQGGDLVVGEV